MERSTREVEIKLPFESPAAAREGVERLGARVTRARYFEDNLVFDRDTEELFSGDILLRLRRAGESTLLTLKLPVEGNHRHKVKEEHETQVADGDAMIAVLNGLGYTTRYRYQKYRTVLRLDDLEICLDETPIGCFVELEGPPDEIDRAAARLGFEPAQYVRETYGELHRRLSDERGVEMGDMLMDRTGATP